MNFRRVPIPIIPGGTSLERWHRDLLRHAMEAEGFTVNEVEWWHFDHRDWRNTRSSTGFEELSNRDATQVTTVDRWPTIDGFSGRPARAGNRGAWPRWPPGPAGRMSGSRAHRRPSRRRDHGRRGATPEAFIVQRKLPPFGQLGQLVAKPKQTGTFEGRRRREETRRSGRERAGRRRVLPPRAVRLGIVSLPSSSIARAGAPTSRYRRALRSGAEASFPFALGTKGVIEHPGHFLGERSSNVPRRRQR